MNCRRCSIRPTCFCLRYCRCVESMEEIVLLNLCLVLFLSSLFVEIYLLCSDSYVLLSMGCLLLLMKLKMTGLVLCVFGCGVLLGILSTIVFHVECSFLSLRCCCRVFGSYPDVIICSFASS